MNKQKILLISIFIITFLIGVGAIIVSSVISSKSKLSNSSTVQQTASAVQVPGLTNETLSCTSTSTNKSLTIIWSGSSASSSSGYMVKGQFSDVSTQSTPIQFGPFQVSQGYYVFDQANGVDTYLASIWIEDAAGNKSIVQPTNRINSSLCTSGTLQIATISASPTPTTTAALITPSIPKPTAAASTPAMGVLSCNNFTLTQNGNTVVNNMLSPGSGPVTIAAGITTTSSGTISYTTAQWTSTPSAILTPSADGSTAIWTPPVSGTNFTISLVGVTDTNGGTLPAPCKIVLTLSGNPLPKTAGETPTIMAIISGIAAIIFGGVLIIKKNSY